MVYKLYNRDGSGGFAVEAALTLVEASFELVRLDSVPGTALPESFREINPWRQVPVLLLPDGTMMTETGAILIHIGLCHPEEKIAPPAATSAHGRFLRWIVFMSANIYDPIQRIGYPERYTIDPLGYSGIVAAARKRFSESLTILEHELEPDAFLLGGSMISAADIYLAMLNAWHGADQGLPLCDQLTHRVAQHPIIAPIWQRNFDHRLATKWGRD